MENLIFKNIIPTPQNIGSLLLIQNSIFIHKNWLKRKFEIDKQDNLLSYKTVYWKKWIFSKHLVLAVLW